MWGFGGCGPKRPGGPFGGPGFFRRGGGWGAGALLRDLDLTDEQVERIAEMKGQWLADVMKMKLTFGSLIKKLSKELWAESIDKGKVKAVFDEIKEEKSKISDEMCDRLIAFAEALTPGQRKKLRQTLLRRFLGLDEPSAPPPPPPPRH